MEHQGHCLPEPRPSTVTRRTPGDGGTARAVAWRIPSLPQEQSVTTSWILGATGSLPTCPPTTPCSTAMVSLLFLHHYTVCGTRTTRHGLRGLFSFPGSVEVPNYVFMSWAYCDKVPRTRCLKQQKFILLVWGPEAEFDLSAGLLLLEVVRVHLCPPLFLGHAGGLQCPIAHDHTAPTAPRPSPRAHSFL